MSTKIPEWCQSDDELMNSIRTHTDDPRFDIPDSMAWTKIPVAKPTRSQVRQEEDADQYKTMFELYLPQIAGGVPLTKIIENDYRCVAQGRFMRWINKDVGRRTEFEKAMEAGVELLMLETVTISDNADEDVQRSALRIKTRQQLAAKYKPKLFGDSKQIDITTKNMTREGLKQLTASQLQELLANAQDDDTDTIDGEFTNVAD